MVEDFNATCISLQTVHCESFGDHSENIEVSYSKRSLTHVGSGRGYCFLKHPKTGNDTLLKWTLQVPSFNCGIGIVITSFINISDQYTLYTVFDLLKITFPRYWYFYQSPSRGQG